MKKFYDVIIIGAGAAGLFCAFHAGKQGRSVLVIEHSDKPGKKIIISGGGRCNFTNINSGYENFVSRNPQFARSALSRYTAQDFVSLVEKHGISYYEKKLGQLFCRNSSKEILNMLMKECSEVNAEILTGCSVKNVNKKEKFELNTTIGDYECSSLVIACGGASIPKMGATDFGYRIAKQFGHNIIKPQPSLVPFTMDKDFVRTFGELSGVSVDTIVTCNRTSFRENILFTHKGLSGPAILQITNYWQPGDYISIDLIPELKLEKEISDTNRKVQFSSFLSKFISGRFADKWCEKYFTSKPLNQLDQKDLKKLSVLLHDWRLFPVGTEGFSKAEVTKGGVDTNELSSRTMESKNIKGLYFIGEVVDVTGWLGGYNFQWAWSSAFACSRYC